MFWLQHSHYLIACSLLASEVLSSPQLEGAANADVVGPSQEIDVNTPSSSNQANLIASKTPSFNEITNNLPLAGAYSPNSQQNPTSNPVVEPKPPPVSQDSAFAPFDENDGLTNMIPSLPSFPQLNNIFSPQDNNPEPKAPPPDTQTDSTERKEPNCINGKFAFCCEKGPPTRGTNKKGLSPEEVRKRQRERNTRLRECKKWSRDNPACSIPANEACCTCMSKRQEAFYCYNPHGIKSPPQPASTPPGDDPNPSEPEDIPDIPRQKRNSNSQADDRRNIIGRDDLLAANANRPGWKRPGGRPRFESTCSDEFLEMLGLAHSRHYKPMKFTPDNPFRRPPNQMRRPEVDDFGWDDRR